jgi:putative PIN family toxin of toxin-antitoxin system
VHRIVIDSNLWISYFIGERTKSKLNLILLNEKFSLLYSEALLTEISGVLARPKFSKYITATQITQLVELIVLRGEKIDVSSAVALSRDVQDDFLLSLCKDGKADYLLTGDNDLLVLNPFEDTKIMRLADFFEQ